jgi:hypothetical protein
MLLMSTARYTEMRNEMNYKENPKTKGSGIICCIPQEGRCPNGCEDCFFQSGRSYLEPLGENLPNMPPCEYVERRVVRVNDGNDSNVNRDKVLGYTSHYHHKFYNTAIPRDLESFNAPVVLTINPGLMTDTTFIIIKAPRNLMFVRFRANTWNQYLMHKAVEHYAAQEIPIIATFMAYFGGAIPEEHKQYYTFRKRTLNSYWAITTAAWRSLMSYWQDTEYEKWVYSCGKVEGERGITACRFCGNCIREYYATIERLRGDDE